MIENDHHGLRTYKNLFGARKDISMQTEFTWREHYATRLTFFAPGFCMGVWAPLIPFVKSRLQVDDSFLGLLLLCIGIGSIFTMPVASALASRFGCRLTFGVSSLVACLSLAALSVTPTVATTAIALLLFGASVGSADCIANVQAVIVERGTGRAMMSGFHGCFSAGGLLGAASVTLLMSTNLSVSTTMAVTIGVAFSATIAALPYSLPYAGKGGHGFVVPPISILLIGFLTLIAALTEGAMLDWSAVYLSGTMGMSFDLAGLGYTVFALIMTVGRLSGDVVVNRLGHRCVIVGGAVISAIGLVTAVSAPSWPISLVGFGLVGIGVCNLFPVLVTMSTRQKVVQENIAVPAILTLGYLGILMGPAIIGLATTWTTLSGALLGLGMLLACSAAIGMKLRY